MRKTLFCGSVALAGALTLAILDSAQHTRMPTPMPNHGSREALAPAADIGISPTSAGSCANEGWRVYSKPKFPSQKSCELWVRRHVAPNPVIGITPQEKKSGSTEVRTAIPFLT